MCKDCDVKGYSKLAKDALIAAIMEKQGQGTSLEQSLARSTSKQAPDPATEQFLQRTSTKVVYSRDESETRIEKNKGLISRRAEISGVTAEKAIDSEAGAPLVKATASSSRSKQQATGVTGSASPTAASPPASLALTLSTATEAPVKPAPASPTPVPARQNKLVVQTNQIQKVGAPEVPRKKSESEKNPKPVPTAVDSTVKAVSKRPAKMVVTAEKIQKVTPAPQGVEAPPEPKERRFQDLPSDDQHRALKNVSKNVLQLLKIRKPDLLKKKAKDLEKYLELLEVEKGRFTVYRPTDKALRGFIDESIALINQVKEEQLNQLEQQYINQELPKVIKKNEQKIKKFITRIDRYYTDMDAAKNIVEKFIKKSPFPQSYLITVIVQKIREKKI
jgi:hypothetical protein